MASVTFKRGTKAEIENTQIQDGQLLMETDQLNNNKIYLDLPNGTRVPVGGSGAWVGTKKEFELAVKEGKIADGTQVIITDDYESGITASMTLYSNAQSGLVATNVQSAIDELDSTIDTLNNTVDTLNSNFVSLENLIGGTKNFVSLDSYLNLSGMFIATISGTASPTGSQYGQVSVIVNTTSSRGFVMISIPNGLYINMLWNGSWSGWKLVRLE